MALILSPLRCPWCQQPVTRQQLQQQDLLKPYLARHPFPCPHCQQPVALPERAETLISAGLFVAVILAPLFFYWHWDFIAPKWLFGLGVALTFTGIALQKLQKADKQQDSKHG